MKRADLLYVANVPVGRFKVLNQRGQIPFQPRPSEDDRIGGEYSLDDAFRLRLMLDLIGGEESDAEHLNGLGPSYALIVMSEAMRAFPRHPLNQFEPLDWWAGVVVFEEGATDDNPRRWSKAYAGELGQFPAWIEQERERPRGEDGGYQGQFQVVRVFAANATRAADFVRRRANERGLSEAQDFSEVRK
jgi:hypothetical protein